MTKPVNMSADRMLAGNPRHQRPHSRGGLCQQDSGQLHLASLLPPGQSSRADLFVPGVLRFVREFPAVFKGFRSTCDFFLKVAVETLFQAQLLHGRLGERLAGIRNNRGMVKLRGHQ